MLKINNSYIALLYVACMLLRHLSLFYFERDEFFFELDVI